MTKLVFKDSIISPQSGSPGYQQNGKKSDMGDRREGVNSHSKEVAVGPRWRWKGFIISPEDEHLEDGKGGGTRVLLSRNQGEREREDNYAGTKIQHRYFGSRFYGRQMILQKKGFSRSAQICFLN